MGPVDLEPAYVLHARRYRETSQLLEVFTLEHGRIGLVARGANRPKSRLAGVLSPFQPLALSWSGRGELKTLVRAELTASAQMLSGERLMSAFYINELIMSFLHRTDPHRDLFAHYSNLITDLHSQQSLQPLLRRFELLLLTEVGYGVNLNHDAVSGEVLQPEDYYRYDADTGPVKVAASDSAESLFSGAHLLAIEQADFQDPEALKAARRLLRKVLTHHLGGRVLQTRRVASAMKR